MKTLIFADYTGRALEHYQNDVLEDVLGALWYVATTEAREKGAELISKAIRNLNENWFKIKIEATEWLRIVSLKKNGYTEEKSFNQSDFWNHTQYEIMQRFAVKNLENN